MTIVDRRGSWVDREGNGVLSVVGRLMQLAGMAVLPLAMVGELSSQLTLWQMLTMTMFGAALFYMGYILAGYGAQ